MGVPLGIRYYSSSDFSGYAQAAVANVRALVNAGIPLQWLPLDWFPGGMRPGSWTTPDGTPKPLLQDGTSALVDVRSLVERTSGTIDHDTVIVHSPPESWPAIFESGKRNLGCTVWETDRAPAHWLSLMRRADRVIVPCHLNREVFRRSGLRVPISVIPHIRRHIWQEYSLRDIADARAELGIPDGHRVFYSINAWEPRKALPELIRAFTRAFRSDDPATLLIKTNPRGHDSGPFYPLRATRDLATEAINAAAAETRRAAPRVILHDEPLDTAGIDLIHAIGEVYVSLSHGEGWGLGAFEAATLGRPVVMTGWGGHTDFLGEDWPGAVPYRLVPVPLWPPSRPSCFPGQRWAESDPAAAVARFRVVFDDPAPFTAAARTIRERIVQDYAEPVLIRHWLEALDA